jgi:tetratricopeptide (TPR) repeat protein
MKFLNRFRKGSDNKSSMKQGAVEFIIPKGFRWTVEDLYKLEFRGEYSEALKSWKILLTPFQDPKIASQITNLDSHRVIWLHIGMCYRHLGMYDQSLVAYNKARELARQADDKKFLAEVSNDIAVVYRHQGKVDKALDLLNKAVNTAEAAKDFTLVVTIHDNIAMCYSDKGLLEKAISEEKKACTILESHPSQVVLPIQSRVLSNLGVIYANLGQFDEAISMLEQALEKARKAGDRVQETFIQNNLSKCKGK